ncbi:MAG TPA: type II toxin-antitoxin system HicA family toxin [Candidatus Hypogeohydataceae bacterium YC38]
MKLKLQYEPLASGHRRTRYPRTKENHVTLRHREDKTKRTVVPLHKGKTLGKGLLLDIIKDAGLTVDEFKELL